MCCFCLSEVYNEPQVSVMICVLSMELADVESLHHEKHPIEIVAIHTRIRRGEAPPSRHVDEVLRQGDAVFCPLRKSFGPTIHSVGNMDDTDSSVCQVLEEIPEDAFPSSRRNVLKDDEGVYEVELFFYRREPVVALDEPHIL